jgi:hypothetical protein
MKFINTMLIWLLLLSGLPTSDARESPPKNTDDSSSKKNGPPIQQTLTYIRDHTRDCDMFDRGSFVSVNEAGLITLTIKRAVVNGVPWTAVIEIPSRSIVVSGMEDYYIYSKRGYLRCKSGLKCIYVTEGDTHLGFLEGATHKEHAVQCDNDADTQKLLDAWAHLIKILSPPVKPLF